MLWLVIVGVGGGGGAGPKPGSKWLSWALVGITAVILFTQYCKSPIVHTHILLGYNFSNC